MSASEARPRKFIGPTQGLKTRTGHGMRSNLENIGGRILIQAEMSNHKHRMKQIKSVVHITPPWGHGASGDSTAAGMAGAGRPGSAAAGGGSSRRNPLNNRASTPGINSSSSLSMGPVGSSLNRNGGGGRPGSSMGGGGNTSALSHHQQQQQQQQQQQSSSSSAPPPPPTDFDLSSLTPEQQVVYRDMLRVLSAVSTKDSKAMLEQLYRESEDRKLLTAYTGVFPGLEKEDHDSSSQA